jgi:hypothetical protein
MIPHSFHATIVKLQSSNANTVLEALGEVIDIFNAALEGKLSAASSSQILDVKNALFTRAASIPQHTLATYLFALGKSDTTRALDVLPGLLDAAIAGRQDGALRQFAIAYENLSLGYRRSEHRALIDRLRVAVQSEPDLLEIIERIEQRPD